MCHYQVILILVRIHTQIQESDAMLKLMVILGMLNYVKAASSYDVFVNLSTTRTDGGGMYFKMKNDDYMQSPGSDIYKDTTVSGNLDVGKVLTLKRVPGISDTTLLTIISESHSGASLASYTSTASNQGCVFLHTTAASSTPWMTGVIRGGLSELVTWHGYNNIGLTLKPTGDAAMSRNLEVAVGAAQTSIKAYVNHLGHQGNVEIEARWDSQGLFILALQIQMVCY